MWLLQHDRLLIHTICGVRQGPLLLHVLLMWMKPHPSGLVHGDVSMTFGDIDEYYNPADDNFNALKPEQNGCVCLCFCLCWRLIWLVNTFRPEQNICNFANNIFKCILRNGKFEILIDISVKFVLHPIDSTSTLVQVMAITYQGPSQVLWCHMVSLGQGQNGCHFLDDILKEIFFNEKYEFQLKFYWSLLLGVQLMISQHWFR